MHVLCYTIWAITNQSLNMILANEEALTRPYQYYVTVCLSVPPTKQFCEAPVVMVQWFVCLSVAMTTSQGYGYGTQSIRREGGTAVGGEMEGRDEWIKLVGYVMEHQYC